MIYYVKPNIVTTTGKCSPNIRIYEMLDPRNSNGFVHVYKNGTYTRKPYNRKLNPWWRSVTVYNSLPPISKSFWFAPELFSSLELATAYALIAYQRTYALAETKATEVFSNLKQSAKLSAEAKVFINANPELFI